MSSTISESQRFLLKDSSSSDDSDIEEMILDDNNEQAVIHSYSATHTQLNNDLTEHHWQRHGAN
jgi:hypothetical protein